MSKKLQKAISVSTSIATIVWMSGLGMLAPLAAQAATINEGDTIRVAGTLDVYIAKYMGTKKFKRLILSPEVFNSYGHLSWSNIKTVTQAEMDAFTTSELVRALGDTRVYKLTPSPNSDVGEKHWMNMTGDQFTAGGFDWDSIYVINDKDRDSYAASSDITSGIPSTGTMVVSLAPNTAPAGTVVDGQSIANLASFNFAAPSNSAVKVTTLKLKRTGVSADATLTNVYLYDGAIRITDSASVSSGVITWNNSAGIFSVPAGTTKTITVKSDVDGTAGETVGVAIIASTDIVTDGATVSGAFPFNGNHMTLATATLAGVSFATSGGTYAIPITDGVPAPQNDFVLWQSTVTITTRAVYLNSIALRQIGSVTATDLANFKLYVDSVQVGSTITALDANGYITFDLTAAPKKLEAGSRIFKVTVDIIGGSTRTTSLSLRYAADVNVIDSEYNANILIQKDSSTFGALSSIAQTIAAGAITFTKKTDSPSGQIIKDATNATLAKFEVKATGENIKIETLDVAIGSSSTGSALFSLRNGALYADGVQVGSTASIRSNNMSTGNKYTRYNLGSSLIVRPGTPVSLEIRADIYNDAAATRVVAVADALRVEIQLGVLNAQKMTSLSYTAAPAATVYGNYLTVKTGSLTLAKYTGYANASAVPPKTAYKIGEWRLTADTAEAVNLTSFDPTWTVGATNTFYGVSKLTDVYFTYGTQTTAIKSTIASTTTFALNTTIASGQTLAIAMYANVDSTTSGISTPTLIVRGTTAGSAATGDSGTVDGQSLTWTTGSLAVQATETPLDQQVYGGQTVEVANYQFTAVSDAYTINQIGLSVVSGAEAAIDSVWLYDGSTLLKEGGQTMNVNLATTTGLNLVVPANTTKTVTVKLKLNSIGTGLSAANLNASTTLVAAYVLDGNGTPSYVLPTSTLLGQGNAVLVFKSYPVITVGPTSYTVTNDSSQTIYKFTVSPSAGGPVYLKQFKFDLAWTNEGPISQASSLLELESIKLYRGSTDISETADIMVAAGTTAKSTSGPTQGTDTTAGLIFAFTTEEEVSASTEYVIKGTPKNFDSGTTSYDQVAITFNKDSEYLSSDNYVNRPTGKIWGLDNSNTGDVTTAAYLIWSDHSSTSHSSTSGSSSTDWFNGYKVKNLSLDTVIVRK